MERVRQHIRDFSHLVFPFNCYSCSQALDETEAHICANCLERFPVTKYWEQKDNTVEKLFWGKVQIKQAASFMFFIKDGMAQSLMHHLKYNGKTKVGEVLGQAFGQKLAGTSFAKTDLIVPIPLHATRQKKRGYNQCDSIAAGMSLSLQTPYDATAVERIRANESQTKKGRYERHINVQELFKVVHPERVEGKHVLLIDDVVTTGSTLEACADALMQVPNTTVSIATIACPSPY